MAHTYPNWYWSVQDSSPGTQVWQGSSGAFVALANADYLVFLAEGNSATVIDTFANLCGVIDAWNRTLWQAGQFLGVKTWPVGSATATNPMVGIQKATPNIGSGATFQLPQMNLFGSIPIGMQVLILKGGTKQDPDLTVVAHDGVTVITTLSRSGGYDVLLELIDNTTTNGSFATQIMLDSILPMAPLLGGTGFAGAPTDAQVLVGNNSNTYTPQSVSGDATLSDTGVVTFASTIAAGGPTGDATHVAQITYDAKGRLTTVASVAITGTSPGGAAGGDLSGTYPNPTVAKVNGNNPIHVADGGTGAVTFTAHGILLGEGTSTIVPTAAMTNGQLLIGQTGADPLPKTITGDWTLSAAGAATLGNIPNDTTMPGDILATNIANPSAPAAGKTRIFVTSADGTLAAINQAGTLCYAARVFTAPAHQFMTAFTASGAFSSAQPAFSDLSGAIANSQFGTQTANTVYAGPTSGGAANPSFRALVGADLPNPSATTLGGIESLAAVSHKWINAISTSGVPSATQPAAADISDYGTGTWTPVDGSGASLVFTATSASYVKLGALVICFFRVVYPVTISGATANIGGLPFAAGNDGSNMHGGYSTLSSLSFLPTFVVLASTSGFDVGNQSGVLQTNAQLSGADIRGTVIYHT